MRRKCVCEKESNNNMLQHCTPRRGPYRVSLCRLHCPAWRYQTPAAATRRHSATRPQHQSRPVTQRAPLMAATYKPTQRRDNSSKQEISLSNMLKCVIVGTCPCQCFAVRDCIITFGSALIAVNVIHRRPCTATGHSSSSSSSHLAGRSHRDKVTGDYMHATISGCRHVRVKRDRAHPLSDRTALYVRLLRCSTHSSGMHAHTSCADYAESTTHVTTHDTRVQQANSIHERWHPGNPLPRLVQRTVTVRRAQRQASAAAKTVQTRVAVCRIPLQHRGHFGVCVSVGDIQHT